MKQEKEILLTVEGKEKLEKEIRFLIDEKRPGIIIQIQDAREQGDLSENADYDAAKAAQGELESRINEITNILNKCRIISKEDNVENQVSIGNRVRIKDYSDKKEYEYEIVGSNDTDPDENKISNVSPLARAILYKGVGEEIEVKGIENPYKIKILDIKN